MSSPGPALPLLTVEIVQSHQVRIDRRLTVATDGSAWHWLLASTDPETSDRVGTFRIRLEDSDLAVAAELAATLAQLPAGSVSGPRELPQVTIRAGDRSHGYAPGVEVDAAVSDAYFLAQRLMAVAIQSPLSALQLAVRPQPAWPRAGQASQFAFFFQAAGSEPVRFRLDRGSFSLRGADWTYHPGAIAGVGLMAAGGRHVDGILAPAELGPGETAALVLRDLPPFTEPGPVRLGVRVEGRIVLLGPEVGPSTDGERFVLSRRVEGDIGPT